jgi:signal transduction histidine kinase
LVNNALKYSSSDRIPEILIKSYIEAEYVVVSVSDNGIGIDADNLGLIFKKHHRVESSVEGNGVGLYLVKETLEISGGKIAVESESGKGSVFRVFIPIKDNPPAP